MIFQICQRKTLQHHNLYIASCNILLTPFWRKLQAESRASGKVDTKMCAPLRCWCFVQIGNFLKITYFHVFPGSFARNSPCIWSGLVFAGRTQHHGLFVATRQPHALNRTANISDTGLAAVCSSAVRWHYVPGIYWITINKCWKYGDLNTFWNQSYGTWKGPRQILIHYDIMKLHSLARLNFSLVECYQVRANAGPEAGLRRGFHDCGTLLPVSATKGQAVTDRDITV